MQRVLKRVLGVVAIASPAIFSVSMNACSTVAADAGDDAGVCGRREVIEDSGDDAPANCETFFLQPCGIPPGVGQALPNCLFNFNDCEALCGGPYLNCMAFGASCEQDGAIVNDDQLVVQCGSCLNITGRRPAGLAPASTRVAKRKTAALGNYFARAAHLEAASVYAFRILRRELSSHGAPHDLLRAAARAERDEVKHTKMMARLGRAHGGRPERVRVVRGGHRSLEAMALENAVEGCVRETFGALVAMWQAERAEDLDVARAMREIAADETRHAALAWTVAAWADAQLDAGARERVNAAKNKAILDLEKEIAAPHPELVRRAGLPNRATQRRLLRALSAELAG